ncbi:polysaccharide lyase family 8 super-sandwich domain-containing protein, partial [Victivallis vadensis]|uniref:polysaccharide lyase family 8 super-sandwich domain-containing protein n=1 Tax=Victivallis vadensis TaxID=172901 RepID=UPI00267229BF
FRREAKAKNLFMLNFPMGQYHGTRYFFNNDDLIRKNPAYYVFVNMVSNRTNGLESYYGGASGFNLFTCDGQTIFEREGGESSRALGAAILTMLPGTTERQVKELKPVENWLGYGSRGDFAAGAVLPDQDAVAGFIFDKVNDSVVENPARREENPEILKLRANKAYFFFGDLFLALGAGIENLAPEYDGNIFTTVEQTLKKGNNPVVRKHGVEWVENNGFVYGVLPQATSGKIAHKSEKRMTGWRKLSEANRGVEENEVELFSMWIDHGREVKDGSYAYFVSCDGKVPERLPEILSNTVKVQAARLGNTVEAVFYDASAGLETPFGAVTVSAPCALAAKFREGKVELAVADGRMNRELRSITVTVGGRAYTVELPSGELLGRQGTVAE